MILKDGNILEHYWGKSLNFRTGRDQLGMQATSIVAYATLLPGLSNLTQHIRYYSLYCWLTQKYVEISNVKKIDFKTFTRRAELLFAFSNHLYDEKQTGVVGSQFVRSYIKLHPDWSEGKRTLDIASCADRKKGNKTYWKHSGGAFAQYYLGPLLKIGLLQDIHDNGKRSISVTDKGKFLADAFEKSITKNLADICLDSIIQGKIKFSVLFKLAKKVNCQALTPRAKETNLLIESLLEQEADGYDFRRETLILMMEYLKSSQITDTRHDFPKALYYRTTPECKSLEFTDFTTTLQIWEFFRINEYMHFSIEAILHFLLVHLADKQRWVTIDDCVSFFQKSVLKSINDILPKISSIKKTTTVKEILAACSRYDNVKWGKRGSPDWLLNCYETKQQIAASVLNIFCLVSRHHSSLQKFNTLADEYNLYREGCFTEIFEYVLTSESKDIFNFLSNLLDKQIITRHLVVAYKKINQRGINTLKFEFQDNALLGIEIDKPTWTSPRLNSLYTFLTDLKLVSESGTLTDTGNALYETCN